MDIRLVELRKDLRGRNPPGPAETASRLNDVAVAYLAAGDSAKAIELLSEAVARDPDNGVALANLTLAYLKHGDDDFAEFYLDLARQSLLRVNPAPAIYVSLGEIYELRNRMEDAIAAWREARRLGDRSAVLLAKMERALRDWAYSRGQRFRSGDHFQIFYDPAIPDEAVAAAESSLEIANAPLAEFFMSPELSDQVVILYKSERFFSATETPDWVAGLYDGKIRAPVLLERSPFETLPGLLRHEMAHAFLHPLSQGRAPTWLQEGLAQYVEGRRTDRRDLERIGARPEGFLGSSTDTFHQRTDRDQARRAYALALSFVEFLAKRGGPAAAVCLAHSLGAGKTVDAACEENFGEPLSGLERRWIASLS